MLTKAAVGSEEDVVSLFLPCTLELNSPIIFESDETFTSVSVSVITLDSFRPLRDVSLVRQMKIDVE